MKRSDKITIESLDTLTQEGGILKRGIYYGTFYVNINNIISIDIVHEIKEIGVKRRITIGGLDITNNIKNIGDLQDLYRLLTGKEL